MFSDDGATVAAATTSHTFAKAGSFTARSISTDSVGNVRELTHPVRVADTRKPAISRLSLQRARFRLGAKPVARTAARRRAKRSTRLRYRLSEDARVTLSRPTSDDRSAHGPELPQGHAQESQAASAASAT